jgi:adenosylcobyric acid synthase
VLNRFRGDASLLAPANAFLHDLTGRDVLGVVPYIDRMGLPEEDSVTFKDGGALAASPPDDPRLLDIAVIDLPHVSNFTDVDALAVEPDVRLRRVRAVQELGRPDAVILPGSKNTLADLGWLRENGLAEALTALAGTGGAEVTGLCAGLQMLGETVRDPLGLESGRGSEPGLGLLPLVTELAAKKTLAVTEAVHEPSKLALHGYEIHHGLTHAPETLAVAVRRRDGTPIGYARSDAPVWGAYLHGIFDADAFRRAFCDGLRRRRQLPPITDVTAYDLEPALDRLADVVEASLDMPAIRRLLGL